MTSQSRLPEANSRGLCDTAHQLTGIRIGRATSRQPHAGYRTARPAFRRGRHPRSECVHQPLRRFRSWSFYENSLQVIYIHFGELAHSHDEEIEQQKSNYFYLNRCSECFQSDQSKLLRYPHEVFCWSYEWWRSNLCAYVSFR